MGVAIVFLVTAARPEHLDWISSIELAATALFAGYVPQAILEETTPRHELEEAQAAGRLWVALVEHRPVGFAHVILLASGQPHLEEMDVLPEFGRRGIGAALLAAVQDWARGGGHRALTLTTFRHLPWNMPFYARHGFREVADDDLSNELRAIVADEAARGLEAQRRVVMRYDVPR